MQKKMAFYHNKSIVILKLDCTLPDLANIGLPKSTDAKNNPFTEVDKGLLEKNREDVVGGPFGVFTRKALVDETFVRKSRNICNSFVGIDARRPCPYSMFQRMSTGLYTQWDVDSETSSFTPRQIKTRSFENMVMSYCQRIRPDCKIENFYTTGRQKKLNASVLMGFVLIAICYLKQWVAFTTFDGVKSSAHLSLKKISNVAVGKENSMNWDEAIYSRKVSLSLKCGNVSFGDFTRQPLMLNYISERICPTDDHLQKTNS